MKRLLLAGLATIALAHSAALAAPPAEKPLDEWITQLRSPRPEARVAAADALGRMGEDAAPAVPALVRGLEDESFWVAGAMSEALSAIGKPALPALMDSFKTGSLPVRLRAGMALKALGSAARPAEPVVRAALKDDLPRIRDLAAQILEAIEGKDSVKPAAANGGTTAAGKLPRLVVGQVDDWSGFRGPRRDGICREAGLAPSWPEGGPNLLWKIDGLGRGYSSVAIVGKRLYTMGDRETPNPGQYVLAFDLGTRRELWATRIGPTHTDGPRATPTVDGKLLYVLGTEGDLACLDVEKGEVRWQQNLAKNYGGQMMSGWKYSESPLVDGDQVVCTPGGPDATVVALRKTTGELLWKCAAANLGEKGKDGAGYSSMVAADIAGVRQYVQVIGRGAIGVRASDGRLLWSYNRIANEVANIPTPLVRGDHVFVTTGYRTGCALLSIKPAGGGCRAEEVYFNEAKQFENHHGGVVLVGDCVFGGDGQNRGAPACLSFASGEVLWKRPPLARGSAAVLYADGHLVFRYDRGEVFWLEANPAEYRIKGQFKPVTGEGPAWAYPVIHNKRLYLRHADVLACYDLAASK